MKCGAIESACTSRTLHSNTTTIVSLVCWFLDFLVSGRLGFVVSWYSVCCVFRCLGFLVSRLLGVFVFCCFVWFVGLLVSRFLGVLASWFQSLKNKYHLRFVRRYGSHITKCAFHVLLIDIDLIFKIFKKC